VKALNTNALSSGMRRFGALSGERILKGLSEAITGSEETVFVSIRALLADAAKLFQEFKDTAWIIWDEIMQGIGRAIGRSIDSLVLNPLRVLVRQADEILGYLITRGYEIGYNAITSLKTGMLVVWDQVTDWLGGIASRVWEAVGPTASMLWDRGYGIISGLLDGMKAAWGKVTDFVGGLAGWIADHKGPLEVDRQLLIPHGRALIAGLNEGLLHEWRTVQGTIGGFNAALGAQGGALAPAAGGGRSLSLVVNGATLQPIDERILVGLLRDYERLYG
jgi:phage-related protein